MIQSYNQDVMNISKKKKSSSIEKLETYEKNLVELEKTLHKIPSYTYNLNKLVSYHDLYEQDLHYLKSKNIKLDDLLNQFVQLYPIMNVKTFKKTHEIIKISHNNITFMFDGTVINQLVDHKQVPLQVYESEKNFLAKMVEMVLLNNSVEQ
jgi:hypothetical protein